MSIAQLFMQTIPHVLETILGFLTVRDLGKCRTMARVWLRFIDSSTVLSRRLYWIYPHLRSSTASRVKIVRTDSCMDEEIIVVDKYETMEDEEVRNIDIYNARDYSPIAHIGHFPYPSFRCMNKMKLVNKILIIFTTSNFSDKVLTYNLTNPSLPEIRNFRPSGRLPLICADADDRYDLSVYSFSPKILSLNSLSTGLLVKRLSVAAPGQVVGVVLGWPRCLALTAVGEKDHPVQK